MVERNTVSEWARQATEYVFYVLALLGGAIVHSRSLVVYGAVILGALLVPYLGPFLLFSILAWAYKNHAPPPGGAKGIQRTRQQRG